MSAEENEVVTDPALIARLNAQVASKKPPAPAAGDAGGGEVVTDPALIARLNAQVKAKSGAGSTGSWDPPDDKLPFTDKVHLGQADNFEEKFLYMQNKYGKDKVTREWGDGNEPMMVVDIEGSKYRVGDSGFVAKLVADSPKLIGMAAGAMAGVRGGPAAMLATAGVGGMVGKGLIESQKIAEGNYKKNPEQLARSISDAGADGAEGEAFGGIAGKLVGKALTAHLPAFITGATSESNQMTKDAWASGGRPNVASMAPDAMKLRRIEVLGEKLTGKNVKQDEKNMAYVIENLKKTLKGNGVPSGFVDAAVKEIQDDTAQSHEAIGKDLQEGVRAHIETFTTSIKKMGDVADAHINAQLDAINKQIEAHPGNGVSQDFADAIKSAKKDFQDQANKQYSRIEDSLGGAKVVPTDRILDAVRNIREKLGPLKMSAMVKEVLQATGKQVSEEDALLYKGFDVELDSGNKITLTTAQAIRTKLRAMGKPDMLNRGVEQGQNLRLAEAVDNAIQEAGNDVNVKPYIESFNNVDNWYKNNVAKFRDTAFISIAKSVRSGMPPDPEKIVDTIAQGGYSARTAQLKKLVSPEVWNKVKSVHMNDFMNEFTKGGEVNGVGIIDKLRDGDYLKSFDSVHGEGAGAQMQEIGRMVAARQGKLDPKLLAKGDVKGALMGMKHYEAKLDEFMKKDNNFMTILSDTSKTGEQAYQWVARPGPEGEGRTMAVFKRFGADSPQAKGIRQAAVEELARNANIKAIDKSGNNAIENALNQYTKKQQELLFPDGGADAFRKLSKVIKFMFPFKSGAEEDAGMAGFQAGAIQNKHFTERIAKTAIAGTMRFVVLHPSFARWIVTGREEGEFGWMRTTAGLIKKMTAGTSAELTQPDNNGTDQQPPQPQPQ